MRPFRFLGVLVLSLASSAAAHDFWIEPSDFEPAVPGTVSLALKVGENFSGRGVRRRADSIARFEALGPQGEFAVPGLEGRDPAGFLRIDAPGPYMVGYLSRGQRIELEAERFEEYLAQEGLEHVVEVRRAAGASEQPGREIFVRCAKALVHAGGAAAGAEVGGERLLGLPLELVLEQSRDVTPGKRSIRLLYNGEGVAGVLVGALRRAAADEPLSARTDAEGRVEFGLSAGEWLIKGVHMVPVEENPEADWKSYWASLTLKIAEPGP